MCRVSKDGPTFDEELFSVNVAFVITEPAGIEEKSKRSNARRNEFVPPEFLPANIAVPAPLAEEPVALSYRVVSAMGTSET